MTGTTDKLKKHTEMEKHVSKERGNGTVSPASGKWPGAAARWLGRPNARATRIAREDGEAETVTNGEALAGALASAAVLAAVTLLPGLL